MLSYARAVASPLDERRARTDPARPPLPRRATRTSRGWPRGPRARRTSCATRTRTCPRRSRSSSPRRSSTWTRSTGLSEEGRARLEEFRTELAELREEARRPVGELPGRGDPPDRPAGRARRGSPDREVARARRRNLAAFLDEVHAFSPARGRAHAPRVPRLRRHGRGRRARGVGPRPAVGRGLGQGDDDPRRQGARVRHRVRAGPREGDAPQRPRSSTTRPSARGRSTSSCAATPPSCRGSTATCRRSRTRCESRRSSRSAAPATSRSRARAATCSSRAPTGTARRRSHARPARSSRSCRPGARRAASPRWTAGRRWTRRTRSPATGRRFVRDWPGPARPDDSDALFPEGWRRSAAGAVRLGAVPASLTETLAPAERATYAALATERRTLATHLRSHRGVDRGGGLRPLDRLGRRARRLRPVPEALLLEQRAAAPAVRRPGRPDRHRDPPMDRAPLARAGESARAGGGARPHRRGARRQTGPDRRAAGELPPEPVRPRGPEVRRALLPAAARGRRRLGTDRRDLRGGRGRAVGGRRLQDRARAGRRRPARPHAARRVRARVHRRVAQAAGGPHAHVPVPVERRGALVRRRRRRGDPGAGRRVDPLDHGERVRPDAGRALPLVRLPSVLRRRPRMDRRQRSGGG